MDLHGQIMNIQIDHKNINLVKDELTGDEDFDTIVRIAYKYGHKHARHAAAELATIQQQVQPDGADKPLAG